MRFKTTFFTLVLFIGLLNFFSCSGDDEEINNNAGCMDFTQAVQEYSDALSTYSQNPSPENCENFKTALRNFAEKYQDCSSWTDAHQEALDNMDDYNCSGT